MSGSPYISYQGGQNQLSGLQFTPINPGSYWSTMPLNILPYYRPAWGAVGAGLAEGLGLGESIMKIPAEQAQLKMQQTQANAQTSLVPAQQAAEQARLQTAKAESEAEGTLVPEKAAATSAGYVTGTSAAVSEARKAAAEAKATELQAIPPYQWFQNGASAADSDAFTDPLTQGVIRKANQSEGLSPITNPQFSNLVPPSPTGTRTSAGNLEGEVKPGSTQGGATPLASPTELTVPPLGVSAIPGAHPSAPPVPTPSAGVVPAAENQVQNTPGKPNPATGQLNTQGVLPPEEVTKWYKTNYDSSAKSAKWSASGQTYTIKTADGEVHVSPQQIFQNLGHYTPPASFTSEVDAFAKNYALHTVADNAARSVAAASRAGGPNVPVPQSQGATGGGPIGPLQTGSQNVVPLPSPTSNAQPGATPTPTPIAVNNGAGSQRGASNAGANPDSDVRVTPDGLLWDSKEGAYVDEMGRHYQGFAAGNVFNRYYQGMPPGSKPIQVPYMQGEQLNNQNSMLLKPSVDGRPAWTPEEIEQARTTPEGQARIQNEIALRTEEENTKPLPDPDGKELASGKALVENGLMVDNALQHMKHGSSDYNWWNTAIQELGDKFGTTPLAGNIIQSINKAAGLDPKTPMSPAVTQLYSAFEKYVNSLPHEMFGRVSQQELGLIRKIIGDPSDQNTTFADRFRNDLVQRQEGYVDKVNQALANRYKVGPNYLGFAEQQRNSPVLQRYVNAISSAQKTQGAPNMPMYGGAPQPRVTPTPSGGPLPSPRPTPRSAAPTPTPGQTTVSNTQSNMGAQNGPAITGKNDPQYLSLPPGSAFTFKGKQYVKGQTAQTQ